MSGETIEIILLNLILWSLILSNSRSRSSLSDLWNYCGGYIMAGVGMVVVGVMLLTVMPQMVNSLYSDQSIAAIKAQASDPVYMAEITIGLVGSLSVMGFLYYSLLHTPKPKEVKKEL